MLCYKNQGNYVVCNELPTGTVGSVGCRTRSGGFWVFCSSNPEGSPFYLLSFCPRFIFLGLGLVFVLGLGLGLGLWLGFKPSPPIVRELVLSLTRLSFPLVRFRHNRV